MEKFELTYKNKQVGTVERYQSGLFTVLNCQCTYFQKIMRLYGFSEESFFDIGVLVPSNSGLCLIKKYSKNDLQKLPLNTCIRFEIMELDRKPDLAGYAENRLKPESAHNHDLNVKTTLTGSEAKTARLKNEKNGLEWQTVNDPSSLFADPELMETASTIKGGLSAANGDIVLFAIPISSEQPFPLMPVFRYGSSAMVEGKCCIVFQIRNGYLI